MGCNLLNGLFQRGHLHRYLAHVNGLRKDLAPVFELGTGGRLRCSTRSLGLSEQPVHKPMLPATRRVGGALRRFVGAQVEHLDVEGKFMLFAFERGQRGVTIGLSAQYAYGE